MKCVRFISTVHSFTFVLSWCSICSDVDQIIPDYLFSFYYLQQSFPCLLYFRIKATFSFNFKIFKDNVEPSKASNIIVGGSSPLTQPLGGNQISQLSHKLYAHIFSWQWKKNLKHDIGSPSPLKKVPKGPSYMPDSPLHQEWGGILDILCKKYPLLVALANLILKPFLKNR